MKNLIVVITAAFLFVGCQSQKSLDDIPIIDTHIHIYDPTRPGGVPWPKPGDKIYKKMMHEQYAPFIKENKITATVIVEASDLYSDNKWVLDNTAAHKDHYVGLVGNIAVGSADFEKQLMEACKDPRFVGIRIRPNKKYPYFTAKFWSDLKALEKSGKTLDILMKGINLTQVADIARKNPKLKILINHLSGLNLSQAGVMNDEWKAGIKKVASYSNVYIKISGWLQRSGMDPAPTNLDFYKPCVDYLVNAFGEDRIVYGSNWPVTERIGSYSKFKAMVMKYCELHDRGFAEKLLYKNAIKFYNLPDLK